MPRRKIASSPEDSSEINVSPLLDMVFILLIFFVVTTTFTRETGVEVNKPKASSAMQIKDKTIKMAVTREGTIHIHEKQVTLQELEKILERERARTPGVRGIIIADEKSETGMVMRVLDKCNNAGLKKTSVAALNE
ncbi:MAG TPA: biopolymer transporter ExbD [Spirochaetota bacterium]|nr:biopolymer transporter ExbD [Spirochaetota bacterium]